MHYFSYSEIKVFKNVAVWSARMDYGRVDNYHMDTLAMWLKFKRVYRSSHFHNRKVPQALNISKPTYLKYVKRFFELGWAVEKGHGFQLISPKAQHDMVAGEGMKYNFWGKVTLKNTSKSLLRTQLRLISVQQKHNRFKFIEGCKNASINYSGKRKVKGTLLKIAMRNAPAAVSMSVKTIGKSFSRSKGTGWREIVKMKDLGILESTKNEDRVVDRNIPNIHWESVEDLYGEGCYYDKYSCMVMKRVPNTITISYNHIALNNIVTTSLPY